MTTDRQSIREIAGDWLMRRNAGLSDAERVSLDRWLESPEHAAEFSDLQETWGLLQQPRQNGHAAEFSRSLDSLQRKRTRRGAVLIGGAVAVLALVASSLFLSVTRRGAQAELASSVTMRPDRQVLADGSSVELNNGARIAVRYDDATRRIELVQGEALFEVASEPTRPFVVSANGVEVRALGTAFSVSDVGGVVTVLVTEGKVSVASPGAAQSPTVLQAGERLHVAASSPSALSSVKRVTEAETQRALFWRSQRVEFSGTPVSVAVEHFNRQNALQLKVEDPALAAHRLSGLFWSDDPEGFVRLLETGMDVVTETKNGVVLLRQRVDGH